MPNFAVIGSGVIGRAWAMIFASQPANKVTIFDAAPAQVEAAMASSRERLAEFEQRGWLRGSGTAAEQMSRISSSTSLEECLKDADYIQECVPEVLAVKRDIFAHLDRLAPKDSLRCSSSSCIAASQFTESLANRGRCMIAHPVNPPYFLPLVEIVAAPWTEQEALVRAKATLEAVGQAPVVLKKEALGFAVNRLQYAVINEAWNLVHEGVLSAEDADKVMTHGLGPRYAFEGPLTVMQLNAEGFYDYLSRYQPGMQRVSADLKGLPDYESATRKMIGEDLMALIPVEKLPEKRTEREAKLAQLAAIKRERLENQ